MEEEMKQAAENGDINAFYRIIEREPLILKQIEEKEFVETPLHTAASCGCTNFAIEMLSLRPSFGRKLNPMGYSPLDLALRNGHEDTVKQLIRYDPELIQVRSRERKTPLHYVTETNNNDLLCEFLVACPTAIKEVTIRGETAVHLAVSNCELLAFKVLIGWLYRTGNKRILDWKDNDGSTVLHIAAQSGQVEVVKILTRKRVTLDIRNGDDKTALHIVEDQIAYHSGVALNRAYIDIQKILHKGGATKTSELPKNFKMVDLLQRIPGFFDQSNVCRLTAMTDVDSQKGLTDDVRNAYLVVTVLLVTASFQAVTNPPGGGWQKKDDNNNNNNNTALVMPPPPPIKTGLFSKELLFPPFIIMNSITFGFSIILTFKLLPFHAENTGLLLLSLMFLMITYLMSAMLISPPDGQGAIVFAFTFGAILIVHLPYYHAKLTLSILAWAKWIPIPSVAYSFRRIYATNIQKYHMERQVRLGKYIT